jgi:hypothetical protein
MAPAGGLVIVPALPCGFGVFVAAAPVLGVELLPPCVLEDEDPPHAVSNNAAAASPAAAAHPLLRITLTPFRDRPVSIRPKATRAPEMPVAD